VGIDDTVDAGAGINKFLDLCDVFNWSDPQAFDFGGIMIAQQTDVKQIA